LKNFRLASVCVFLIGLYCARSGLAQAEILAYGTKPKSWSGYSISEGSKSKFPGAPNPDADEGFYFWELDGVDRILEDDDRTEVTYRGETFFPSSVYLSHQKKTKRITGSRSADENLNSFGRSYYGRAVAPGGIRIFRALYQQWENPRPDAQPTDTGIGLLEGACKLINIGGGKTGYYAPRLAFQLWRLDDTFAGSVGSYGDGRQIKYWNQPLVLYEALTREINNRRLNKSDAVIFAVGYLFPQLPGARSSNQRLNFYEAVLHRIVC